MSTEFIIINGVTWLSESGLIARLMKDVPDKTEVMQNIADMVRDNVLEKTMREGKVYYIFSNRAAEIIDAMNRSGTA